MENDNGTNVSQDDGNCKSRSYSDSSQSAGKSERGDPVILHELRIDDDYDAVGISKKLILNGKGEQWLLLRDSPEPRIQQHVDQQIVSNEKHSSQDDKKREGQIASTWKSNAFKTKEVKTSFTPIMQTQDLSLSQKTLTQMQTQTQEIGTQDSMSLMEYLNQPSQNDNHTDIVHVGIGSTFKIVSGADLASLYAESKSSPMPLNCGPSDSAFLCFEHVSIPGATESAMMTVKDTRLPQDPQDTSDLREEEIYLWRANENQGDDLDWKPLPRRKLTILCPGDQIRIKTKPSKAREIAMSIDPDVSIGTKDMIFLEYRRVETSTKHHATRLIATKAQKNSLGAQDEGENDTSIEMNVDGESQNSAYLCVSKDETSNKRDKDSNSFVGTTTQGAGKDSPLPGRSILPSQDSTINSQQETLRSSRMGLLNLPNDPKSNMVCVKNANADCNNPPQNESSLGSAEGSNENEQNDGEKSATYDNKRADDDSSDATILDENHKALFGNNTKKDPKDCFNETQESESNQNKSSCATTPAPQDSKTNKSDGDNSESEHSSDVTIAFSITSDAPPNATIEFNNPPPPQSTIESDQSSAATMLMTQEVDRAIANSSTNGQDRDNSSCNSTNKGKTVSEKVIDKNEVESDDESVLGKVIMMQNTRDSSIEDDDATSMLRNQSNAQGVVIPSNEVGKGDISEDTRNSVDNEDDVIEVQAKDSDKVEALDLIGSTTKVCNENGGEDNGMNKCSKNQIPEGLNETSAVKNDGCGSENPSQARMKRSSASMQDCPLESHGDKEVGVVPHKRRRRTFESKNYNTDVSSSNRAIVSAADNLYRERFRGAIEGNVINILVSGFEQNEIAFIPKLCKTKFLNGVNLKMYETVDENITACILPTMPNDNEEASRRTLKSIQCALMGIPLVPLAWLEKCEKDQKIVIPKTYIRTLPTNIGTLKTSNHAQNGVARLAAARFRQPQNPCLIFQNTSVYLCGKYSNDKKRDLMNLLEKGSATVATTSRDAIAKLDSVVELSRRVPMANERFVLLVGDRGTPIPQRLQKKIFLALEEAKAQSILVVDSKWVSISIASASMLPATNFKPKLEIDLWRLSEGLQN